MQISRVLGSTAVFAALCAAPAVAFEIKDLTPETPPVQVFTYGVDQYNSGDKTTAAEALDFAAKKGIPGAQWKLASMYADGDGVSRDDMKAFQLFSQLAAQGSDDDVTAQAAAPYVSNAYVRLGTYYRQGIPNSKVKPDFSRARQAFTYAASFFGNADAQFNLARMYYSGEGGDRDLVQAAKWANLSAHNHNIGAKALAITVCLELAQNYLDGKDVDPSAREAARWARQAADYDSIDGEALLGHILFEGDDSFRQPVDGLMYLQIALARSGGGVQWILDMHEAARSVATLDQWNTAKQRADLWLATHPGAIAATASSADGDGSAGAPVNIAAPPLPISAAALGSPAVSTSGDTGVPGAPIVSAVAVPSN
jgi:TPR repeat protein